MHVYGRFFGRLLVPSFFLLNVVKSAQDVEGHEGIVLSGGHATFARTPYVFMELSPQLQWAKAEVPQQTPPATLQWLRQSGYHISSGSATMWAGPTLDDEEIQKIGATGQGTRPQFAVEGPQFELFLSRSAQV